MNNFDARDGQIYYSADSSACLGVSLIQGLNLVVVFIFIFMNFIIGIDNENSFHLFLGITLLWISTCFGASMTMSIGIFQSCQGLESLSSIKCDKWWQSGFSWLLKILTIRNGMSSGSKNLSSAYSGIISSWIVTFMWIIYPISLLFGYAKDQTKKVESGKNSVSQTPVALKPEDPLNQA